jgi:hypothetical protein
MKEAFAALMQQNFLLHLSSFILHLSASVHLWRASFPSFDFNRRPDGQRRGARLRVARASKPGIDQNKIGLGYFRSPSRPMTC